MAKTTWRCNSKAELLVFLTEVDVDEEKQCFILGSNVVEVLQMYMRNCKEAPSKENVVLPGFEPAAIRRSPTEALTKFRMFCKSQFGQCQRLGRPFFVVATAEPSSPKPVATLVSLTTTHLVYRLLSGAEISREIHHVGLNSTVRSLAAGVHLVTDVGTLIDEETKLLELFDVQKALADFKEMEDDDEYLKLSKGEEIIALPPPLAVETCGWAYGMQKSSLRSGWYPPTYVA
jgi:hypothetical protein